MWIFLLSRVLERVPHIINQILLIKNIRPINFNTHLTLLLLIIIQHQRLPHPLNFAIPNLLLEFFHFSLQLKLVISQSTDMICHELRLFIERVVIVFYGFLVGLELEALFFELLIGLPKGLDLGLKL